MVASSAACASSRRRIRLPQAGDGDLDACQRRTQVVAHGGKQSRAGTIDLRKTFGPRLE